MRIQTIFILAALVISGCITPEKQTTTTTILTTSTIGYRSTTSTLTKSTTTTVTTTLFTTPTTLMTSWGTISGRVIETTYIRDNFCQFSDVSLCVNNSNDVSTSVSNVSNVRVVLFHNLSYMNETQTNHFGEFSFYAKTDNYGILFYKNGHAYIYNQDINRDWEHKQIVENIVPQGNSQEPIIFDIGREKPDFTEGVIYVALKNNSLMPEEINKTALKYGCEYVSKNRLGFVRLKTPSDQTELEIQKKLSNDPNFQQPFLDSLTSTI
ncbi:MAG: hypothetical protein GF416_04395 [Candidatus Altiarchaeales archaeon]|nr:hypothetical protein [Candidatus Altiarchaeales archaeon]MBD3416360.1 hypothetical protein [Candidatus Altiarchaeales archaeon]